MKIKLLPSWGCADVIVISIFSIYITFCFFTTDFLRWRWKIDKLENALTFMLPTFSVIIDWGRFYELKTTTSVQDFSQCKRRLLFHQKTILFLLVQDNEDAYRL